MRLHINDVQYLEWSAVNVKDIHLSTASQDTPRRDTSENLRADRCMKNGPPFRNPEALVLGCTTNALDYIAVSKKDTEWDQQCLVAVYYQSYSCSVRPTLLPFATLLEEWLLMPTKALYCPQYIAISTHLDILTVFFSEYYPDKSFVVFRSSWKHKWKRGKNPTNLRKKSNAKYCAKAERLYAIWKVKAPIKISI